MNKQDLINYGAIGVAFIALYTILSPRIDAIAASYSSDHDKLTASLADQASLLEDVKDIKRVVYNVAPQWGVNPNAGKPATTTEQ